MWTSAAPTVALLYGVRVRRAAEWLFVGATILFLTGCSSRGDGVSPLRPSPPSEASLELRAESVWNAYYAAYTELLAGDSTTVTDIKPYLTPPEYEVLSRDIREFRDAGYRIDGAVSSRGFELTSKTRVSIEALVCVDNEASRLLDGTGKDVSPNDRSRDRTIHVTFVDAHGKVLIDSDALWKKESVC